jgi:hypothetical protein
MSNVRNHFQGIFISDNETATDLLYYETIAKTLVGYIESFAKRRVDSLEVQGQTGQ